jgi:AraC-like DNA-binding protein
MSRLDRVTDWLEKARLAGYNPGQLARICGVSATQLRRFFQAQMQKSPRNWLNELRLQEASIMLVQGASVKEVSADLKFSDSAHFCHEFKRRFHCTPSVYAREQWKINQSQERSPSLSGWLPRIQGSDSWASVAANNPVAANSGTKAIH